MTLEQGCTGLQPLAGNGAGNDKPSVEAGSGGFDPKEAPRFLDALGKDRAQTWVRAIDPLKKRKAGPDHQGLTTRADLQWLQDKTAAGFNLYAVIGEAPAASGAGGGVTNADVTGCSVLFAEWDDGASIEEQAQRWQAFGLPEPTVMVTTGGKSVHAYWLLIEPMQPDEWRVLQERLITYVKGDQQCKNPSRVMRLPGSVYYDKKTGEATGRCSIIATCEARYTASDIEARLTPEEEQKPVTGEARGPSAAFKPRGIDEINAAAEYIPRRKGGEGTYEQDRNALCGCSAALAEAGVTDPDGAALALLGHLWPSEAEARQVLKTATTRKADSFWAIAQERGYNLKRKPQPAPKAAAATQTKPKPKKERKGRKLGHTKAMACFERCVQILAKRERNNLRRRALLLAIAKALGLSACINRPEIAQRVLEAKDEQQGQSFKALTAADRLAMKAPVVRWLIADLVPAGDLTIIGGRPKVGKTRLAVAIAAAVLKGEPFAGFGCIKEPRPVLLITDDQADGDTHQMLQQLKVWDHPLLIWSRHFRLNERDTDQMLETIKANPGALVVMDSLRSVSRSLPAGENDPEMGTYLYDLKAAVIEAGGSLIVIHHCNKAADLVGTDALSGHNAISGAANTVITLHHCPDANGRPDKSNPQRRMFSEGRSGAGCDLVIDRQTGGTYRQVAGFDQWQRQLEEAKKQHKRSEGLTPTQQQLRELLEEQPSKAFTRRQLVEAMGLDWGDGRGSDPKRVRDALNRLVGLEVATKRSAGKELLFSSRDSQKETSPMSPSSPSSDTKGFQGDVQGDGDVSFVSFQSRQGVSGNGTAQPPPPPPAKETKETFDISETSPSDRLQQQQGDEGDVGDALKRTREKKSVITPPTIPGFVDPAPAAVGSGADVMDDDDDPHWGPKPQGAAA